MATSYKQTIRLKMAKAVAAANRGECSSARTEYRIGLRYAERLASGGLEWQMEEYRGLKPTIAVAKSAVNAACPRGLIKKPFSGSRRIRRRR